MSRVFEARDVSLGRTVVIKVISAELAAGVDADRFRREIQLAYNAEHGITPETVSKGISDISDFLAMESRAPAKRRKSRAQIDGKPISSPEELERVIVGLEEEMLAAAEDLRFEEAARLRDELKELRRDLEGMRA